MKIALICPYDFYRPGGVQFHIRDLATSLRQNGHVVHIIAPPSEQIVEKVEKDVFFFGKRKSIIFNKSQIDVSLAFGHERKRLQAFLKQQAYDVFHFHTIWDPFLPIQILRFAGKSARVATFHDTPPNTFGGKVTKGIFYLLSRVLYRWLDKIIAVSSSPEAHLYKSSNKPIHVIPPCIDYTPFVPQSLPDNKPNETFKILFLARLDPRKGIMIFLEAAKQLSNNFSQIEFRIAGSGNQYQEAKNFIENHTLDNVKLLGNISEEDKIKELQQADIFCSPALYGESFGISLVESMAAGTPVIAAANSGYSTVLAEQKSRCLTLPNNVKDLTEKIAYLLQNPDQRTELTNWGIEEAQKHDVGQWRDSFEKLYMSAMEDRQTR